MSDKETLHGLNCPRCGGMVPIPEGQAIVRCPFCDLRSLVRGERGVRRYQVSCRLDQPTAAQRLGKFLSSNWAIAFNARSQAQISETFLTYIPFWAAWARVLGWAFGQRREGSGKNARYVPHEVRVVEEMHWNGAACDVGEFGVMSVPLTRQPLEAFDSEALHARGLVFEPVSAISEAETSSRRQFEKRVADGARLSRLAQAFTRYVNERFGVVYYPLWVLRYLYRGRAFQVVVDGYSGDVLYGKAPGNTWYRAAMLVGGMALGAAVFMAGLGLGAAVLQSYVDVSDDGEGVLAIILVMMGAGAAIMGGAYAAFRFGEQYEYRRDKPAGPINLGNLNSLGEVAKWINQ